MHFLGLDFIVSSIFWLILVFLFIFIFKEQIKKLLYGASTFDLFLTKLKTYLKKTYPKIKFNFDIIEESKIEENPSTRKYLIADNIVTQFIALKIDPSSYPSGTPSNIHWSGYAFHCEPNKDKLPKDWAQRKQALLARDKKVCFRCGKNITAANMEVHMIRGLDQGGKYFLENLLPVCKDCHKLLDHKKINYLQIKDDLYDIVKTS
ncbi:MAG: HNH endonuclease signature motif containing protein [Campylobacterota bacterium]|nr:HNH endonuclease signature motif containing protein [Campylobacterota bacterium]